LPLLERIGREPPSTFAVEDCLRYALETSYSHEDEFLARALLERASAMISSLWYSLPYPMDDSFVPGDAGEERIYDLRPHFAKARAFVEALLGQSLDNELLLFASRDYERSVLTLIPHEGFDGYCESQYLASIRAALIANGCDRAYELLGSDLKFGVNRKEHQLLVELAAFASGRQLASMDLFDRFDRFFDDVRNPEFRPNYDMRTWIVRFEYGVLREIYFSAHDKPISWQRVIDVISQ
jgi:hypothetical protein